MGQRKEPDLPVHGRGRHHGHRHEQDARNCGCYCGTSQQNGKDGLHLPDDATGSKVTKDIIKTIATLPDAVEGLTGLDLKNAIAKATRLSPPLLPSCNDTPRFKK